MIFSNNITKYFGTFKALDNISFEAKKGEIIGFLGLNGAGKTTLMRILTSYLPPTSGRLFIAGQDIRKKTLSIRRKIGYLPETPPLYTDMIVKDYLKFAARLKDVAAKDCPRQIDKVLNICDICDVAQKGIAQLSKGYRQRVGIAQAIIHDPQLLILDEPTSGLDPLQVQGVRRLIKALEHKRTVILSTHILSEIHQLAQRVLIIKGGKILKDSPLNVLLKEKDPANKCFLKVKGDARLIEQTMQARDNLEIIKIESQEHIVNIEIKLTDSARGYNSIIKRLLAIDADIVEVSKVTANLEDLFIELHDH